MDYSNEFERCFVETVVGIASEQGLSHSELARRAFPDAKDYRKKWRKVRGSKKQKPQQLSLIDAASLSKVVKKDIPGICFVVDEKIKNGWTFPGYDD